VEATLLLLAKFTSAAEGKLGMTTQTQRGLPTDAPSRAERPIEMMRGRYMVKNPKAVALIWLFDTVCGLALRQPRPKIPESPQRILICNWAHLGDVVLSLPSLKALRDAFPDVEIGLLIGSWSSPVAQNTGLYDHLHCLDNIWLERSEVGFAGRILPFTRQSMKVIKEIRAKRYDIAIDLYSYFPSAAIILYLARVPVRCGFSSGGFGTFLTHAVRWQYQGKSIGRYGQNLLASLWPDGAIARHSMAPCYPRRQSAPLPPKLAANPYILLHIGAGAPTREWADENWQGLINALVDMQQHMVIAGAGAREIERARRMLGPFAASKQYSTFVTLCLDQPWDTYVTIVANARCLVCLESSSAHIAAAFQTPTIAIYGGGVRSFGGIIDENNTLWGPDNPHARVLTSPTASPNGICFETVLAAVQEHLKPASVAG
jgi:ADP-heptose:LPS heptosyltransferase